MRASRFLALPVITLGFLAAGSMPAAADEGVWQADLAPANNSGTSGHASVEVHGSEATVTVQVNGAAAQWQGAPFPHAQHIHIGGAGLCAGPEADADGDGAVSSMEGMPLTGSISTSLTLSGDTGPTSSTAVDRFPAGPAYSYERTVPLDAATLQALQAGTATFEVHGVDPALLSSAAQAKPSPEDPSLPLAATLPAACGTLMPSQVSGLPAGAADAGITTASDTGHPADAALPLAGALAVGLAAAGMLLPRRGRSQN